MFETEYKNYSMTFDRKGYGRIFVEKEEDVIKVENILKEIDEYEFNNYYIDGTVAVFGEENFKSKYVGKFDDIDIGKVLKIAWSRGIHCFVVFGKVNQFDE